MEHSTEDPPETVGLTFASDVLKRNKQLVFVLRETSTSYTVASLIENEKRDTVRDSLICLCMDLHPIFGPPAVVRVDPAPCFIALRDDNILRQLNINLDIGRVKNVNKNPVAEKAISELEDEIQRLEPSGCALTKVQLSIAVSKLNCRIRREGMSAKELRTQRNQFTHEQLPICDKEIILNQHQARLDNHKASEKCKNKTKSQSLSCSVTVGDLVYLYNDRNKLSSRQHYLVVSSQDNWLFVKKFTGNQLRSTSYKIRQNECFRVPCEVSDSSIAHQYDDTSDSEDRIEPPEIPNQWVPSTLTEPIEPLTVPFQQPEVVQNDQPLDTLENPPLVTVVSDELQSSRPKRTHRRPKYLEDYDCT